MDDLYAYLPPLIERWSSQESVREQAVLGGWDRIVGEPVSRHCTPYRIFDRRLIVLTSDRTWKTQMERISGEILRRLNQLMGHGSVTFIEYRVDAARAGVRSPENAPGKNSALPAKTRKALQAASTQIEDADLRERYLRAATKYLARRAYQERTGVISGTGAGEPSG
ncbi:MAG: DUF721 domain-containing protein [Acidobacteria bacterium]|nr:DUF721 domain-containing protein [Acidobacteriota bacterium]